MRIRKTGEVIEILCGEVGRTAPARECGSMWASTPTDLIRSEIFRITYVKYSTGANRKALKNQNTNQRSVCVLERTSNGMDELSRLRGSEGYGVCEDAARRAFLDRRCNEKTHNETKCFFARQRYFASCASFLHTFFWQDRKKYARGATVAVAQ